MRFTVLLRYGLLAGSCAWAQNAPEAKNEAKGMPPRPTPADYQFQAKAGNVTIAAEFTGHAVPTLEGKPLNTDDYVVVEAAFFGPADSKLLLSTGDFSLRINGKKTPSPSEPYGLVLRSLKDPEWSPPEADKKSKTSFGTGGGQDGSPPPPVKIPIELQRAMAQKVQKVSMPEGERPLPQAGVLFFEYRGKPTSIHSIELIYSGPAGKATLTLQP